MQSCGFDSISKKFEKKKSRKNNNKKSNFLFYKKIKKKKKFEASIPKPLPAPSNRIFFQPKFPISINLHKK